MEQFQSIIIEDNLLHNVINFVQQNQYSKTGNWLWIILYVLINQKLYSERKIWKTPHDSPVSGGGNDYEHNIIQHKKQ